MVKHTHDVAEQHGPGEGDFFSLGCLAALGAFGAILVGALVALWTGSLTPEAPAISAPEVSAPVNVAPEAEPTPGPDRERTPESAANAEPAPTIEDDAS